MTYKACKSQNKPHFGDQRARRKRNWVGAEALWNSRNHIITINNKMEVQGNETARYERMGTRGLYILLLSCKLHGRDKATIAVTKKKKKKK